MLLYKRDVGLAVAIDVAGFDGVVAGTPEQGLEVEHAVAVAEADISRGRLRVVYDQVGLAIAVKIAGMRRMLKSGVKRLGT